MSSVLGIQPIGNYVAPATDKLRVQALIDLIPNIDLGFGVGAQAGRLQTPAGAGFLDEMSPAAATQLRVELLALFNAVT